MPKGKIKDFLRVNKPKWEAEQHPVYMCRAWRKVAAIYDETFAVTAAAAVDGEGERVAGNAIAPAPIPEEGEERRGAIGQLIFKDLANLMKEIKAESRRQST